MQVTVSKLPENRVSLNVEIEEERVEKAFDLACKNISKKTSISGFRKGKVPRKILERIIGKEAIAEEACNLILSETYPEAVKKSNISPIGEPELKVEKLEEGTPMVFTAQVDVKPDLTNFDYKSVNVELTKDTYEVKDKNIEESLNMLKTQLSQVMEVKDRGIEKGDFVDLGIQISYPDEPEKEPENLRKRTLFTDDNFIPEVVKEVQGMKIDEAKEFDVVSETENGTEKKLYSISVNNIMEIKSPELTDEFIQQNTRFKSLDEIKEKFKQDWEKILGDERKEFIKENILNKLLAELEKEQEIKLPEGMVSSKVNNLLYAHILQLAQSQMSLEDYLKEAGMEKEAYIEKLREKAGRDIKLDFIFDRISEAENISIPKEELDDAVSKLKSSLDKGKNRKSLDKKDLQEYMKKQLKKQRVIDFLIANTPVVEN